MLVNWMVSNAWHPCATFYNAKILSLLPVMPHMPNYNMITAFLLFVNKYQMVSYYKIVLNNKTLGAHCYTIDTIIPYLYSMVRYIVSMVTLPTLMEFPH